MRPLKHDLYTVKKLKISLNEFVNGEIITEDIYAEMDVDRREEAVDESDEPPGRVERDGYREQDDTAEHGEIKMLKNSSRCKQSERFCFAYDVSCPIAVGRLPRPFPKPM